MADSLHIAFVASEMVPLHEDGRPRRRRRGAAQGARPARPPRHRLPAALRAASRSRRASFAGSVHVPVDAVPRSAGFYRRELRPSVEVVFVEHPPFFDRPAPVRRGQPRLPGQPRCASRSSRARASSTSAAAASGRTSSTRTTGRRACVPVYLKSFYWDDPTLHRTPDRLHDPQPGLPGQLRGATRSTARPALEPRHAETRSSSTAASAT